MSASPHPTVPDRTGLDHTAERGSHACHCGRDGPPASVSWWRRCRLLEAGFPDDLATALAMTPTVDLHALLQLVDRGCPPRLAARILAPQDGPA